MRLSNTLFLWLLFIQTPLCTGFTEPYRFSHIDANKGLSHNQITCIYKDTHGFVWFGTAAGLNRFDGTTITQYTHNSVDSNTICDNSINSLTEDPEGNLWIFTRNGTCIYNPETELFSKQVPTSLKSHLLNIDEVTLCARSINRDFWIVTQKGTLIKCVKHNKNETSLYSFNPNKYVSENFRITSVFIDEPATIWIAYSNGIIESRQTGNFKLQQSFNGRSEKSISLNIWFNLFCDSDHDLWYFNSANAQGVYYIKRNSNKIEHIDFETGHWQLNTSLIYQIIEEKPGKIWIGTDHGGINVIDKLNHSITYVLNEPDDEKSLSQNVITAMHKDDEGIVWIGTYKKGVNYYHPDNQKFKSLKNSLSDLHSLPADDINCFEEDKQGNLWIGTNNSGLIYYNQISGHFTSFKHNPLNINSLSSNTVVKLHMDKSGLLWIGTYTGGLDCYDGTSFRHFCHSADPNSISSNNIWEITEDSKGNFWIGTLGGGLNLFDRQNNIFYKYTTGNENTISSNYISAITEDKYRNLWIGTAYGISVLENNTGKFTRLIHRENDSTSLGNNSIICMMATRTGYIWAGTHEGLTRIDPLTREIRNYKTISGIAENMVVSVVEDKAGNLWLGTPIGLFKVHFEKLENNTTFYTTNLFNQSDGLLDKGFNERAAFRAKSGELFFGSASGVNYFNPENTDDLSNSTKVVLTNLYVFNKKVVAGAVFQNRVILNKSITYSNEIELKYNENVFSIEFGTLNFLHPEKVVFKYMLEGFNNVWLEPGSKQNLATFTNLDPGTYTLKVKALINNRKESESSLKIVIIPPFWKTKIALIFYIILFLGLILLLRRFLLYRARLSFMVENQRKEAVRLHELDMMKIRFFTNVSHEFRTPLSLIIAPVEKLLRNNLPDGDKPQLETINRNAKRLLNLVNQLLDFRRIEVQETIYKPVILDIVSFTKDVTYSFSDISESKSISLLFTSNVKELEVSFDADKLEKVILNLLSNAFKFTEPGGKVSVELIYKNTTINPLVEIRVNDTGIGIPKDKTEKIFEAFFQNETPGRIVNQGSGIGLAIAKEFIKVHSGKIWAESEPGKGSSFIIQIPVETKSDTRVQQIDYVVFKEDSFLVKSANEQHDPKKPQMVIAEDNDDLLFYLKDNLKHLYNIKVANNGKLALEYIENTIPDIVISDIIMPEINGTELCEKIKNDKRTSHIPVILLTANTDDAQKLAGYNCGADAYITKPFSFEVLEARIKNILLQRKTLKESFSKYFDVHPSESQIESLDEKLLRKALELVEQNISNADFSVEEFSRALNMSRVQLYKKLLALTGKTPIEFIRLIRLKRAAQLLQKSQLTVAEVAFETGFNNPKYFAKYFKDEFKLLPSQYKANTTIQ